MINPDLAGGALLDLGIYALTWVFQTLYHLQPEDDKETPTVVAAINKYDTGADETTSIIVQFPKHKSQGIALTKTAPIQYGSRAPSAVGRPPTVGANQEVLPWAMLTM